MKKIISVITLVAILLSLASISAVADIAYDPMNNELFSVISQIKDTDTDDGLDHGKLIDSYVINNYPGATLVKLYADGTRVSKEILGEDYRGYIYFAGEGFPAYLDEKSDNKYILEEQGYSDNESVSWYYLIEVTQSGITQDLISTVVSTYNPETNEYTYDVEFISKDENGTEVSTPVQGNPLNYDEYSALVYDELQFNDGWIYKSSRTDGVAYTGYYDILGNCVWEDPQISYYGMSYNLGYTMETYNNGGSIDWNEEDAEKQRRYETVITNTVTNQSYMFTNTKIENLYNSLYSVMVRKDDLGNEIEYLIKLKIPAITTVHLNGEKIYFDQIPVIENGRTLVPLRAIFEALGASVSWDGATNTVTAVKDNTEIKLTIDSTDAYKNGELIKLDVPAKLINGRTLVPVRFVADSFGVNVEWNGEDFQVILTK